MELAKLIPLLRAHGVKRYKGGNTIRDEGVIEIEFEYTKIEAAPLSISDTVIDAPLPPNMPPELRDSETMSFDKIRDWSASPGAEDEIAPLPGTGDVALGEP